MSPPLLVRSAQGDYPVDFPESLPDLVESLLQIRNRVLLVDHRVLELYAKDLSPLVESTPTYAVHATEEAKTLTGVAQVTGWLQRERCERQSVLVVVGGGVTQDLATFSAHVYFRGIRWLFVPTTLLSMADSCIGAKCAINLNDAKNQLGAFHSPSGVLLCPRFVDTLPDADVASGYGEILKLMVIGSQESLSRLIRTVSGSGLRNLGLPALIRESLLVKKQVIEEDEYEKDARRILNYGHTFGHSLESLTDYEVPHGHAVAWGMDLVNYLSMRRGMLAEASFREIHEFIRGHLRVPVSTTVSATAVIEGARRDKKVDGGAVNLVLLEEPGRLKIVRTPFDDWLSVEVSEYLDRHDVFGGD